MLTLDEHNSLQRQAKSTKQCYNAGVLCPKCRGPMFVSNPGIVLTSNPPKQHVHCQCGYKDLMVIS